jgi:hypothetical protein
MVVAFSVMLALEYFAAEHPGLRTHVCLFKNVLGAVGHVADMAGPLGAIVVAGLASVFATRAMRESKL